MKKLFLPLPLLLALLPSLGCQSDTTDPVVVTPEPVVDTLAPVATVLEFDAEQLSLQFEIHFIALDNQSGVADVELFVFTPDQSWTSLGSAQSSPAVFVAQQSGPHGFAAVATDSAGNRQSPPQQAQALTQVPEPIIITDLHGEDFDITNAVNRYFLTASAWGHGVGRNTIRPIVDPVFISPGEPGYPDPNNLVDIMAVADGDDVHAYKIGDIRNREAVNDVVNGAHLAATY